jgi:CheY-like chemotaxis protein
MHRILILDDDEAASSALEEVIKSLGHSARRSTFGPAVWNAIRNWLPDMAILDGDPDGNFGCDFLAQVRADAFFAALPVVVSAGVTRRDLVERFLHFRVQGIMVKPCDVARVSREIERANRVPFRASFFTSIEGMTARTGRDPAEFVRTYRQVAGEIQHALGDLAVLTAEPFTPHALTTLFGLKGCGLQAGCLAFSHMVDEAFRGYNRLDARPIRRAVQDLPVFVRLLLRQAEDVEALAGVASPVPAPSEAAAGAEAGPPAGETASSPVPTEAEALAAAVAASRPALSAFAARNT